MPPIPLAIQLYTLRELTRSDFAGTLRQVAGIGYTAVELAGYGNLASAAEVKMVLDDNQLRVAGSHIAIDKLENRLDEVLDENEILGNRNIVCPTLPKDRRDGPDAWKHAGELFTRIAATCHEKGYSFAYHNHSFEFQQIKGRTAFDILLDHSDPQLVELELDVYWAWHGGFDPVALLDRLGNRVTLLHLKDMAPGEDRRFAPVGSGILDFPAILRSAEKAGAQWNIVEQDQCYDTPPLEAARTSFENLNRLGSA